MRLHNFIKIDPGNKDNIYFIPMEIFDNTGSNGDIPSIQSSSAEINNLRDKMAAKMWEDYQVYLAL